MKPPKKPKVDMFIVTPVWGAYDITKECIKAVQAGTEHSFYHLAVNDNYQESLREHFSPAPTFGMIDVYNDPIGFDHVEQIGKMMDLGLAFGKNFITFKHFVKLESDCIVQPGWDTTLLREAALLGHFATLEAYSNDMPENALFEKDKTYQKEWVEHNCALFSPEVMNLNWSFSAWPHAVDQHLCKHLSTQSGDLQHYETTRTWIDHYRSSSRKNYDKS